MKTLFLVLFASIAGFCAEAQDSWMVVHGGKIRLKSSEENEEKNIVGIKAADLKKTGHLLISYIEAEKQKDWKRTIIFVGPGEKELLKVEGPVARVQNAKLKALAAKSKTIKVYTISLPSDPNVAATVRVRRVHLCTLSVK
ncbi:MAG TPA: hypothetical protein VGB46_12970 [Flavisolibacter sp.]|jgi:hypothetical protein